ncbi:MAG: NAD(P)H-dependent oxidoreductase [Eubacteriales bacterium]|nr:NAD(P)H-dependent oxidoreductase [Eubacteriales bacterium]
MTESGKKLIVCQMGASSKRLDGLLAHALMNTPHTAVEHPAHIQPDSTVLFAAALEVGGYNPALYESMAWLRRHKEALAGCTGGIVIDGQEELYTKDCARAFVLAANAAGCAFVGRPLAEGTGTLHNYRVVANYSGIMPEEAYRAETAALVERLTAAPIEKRPNPKLLVLHASNRTTSNTLLLWSMVKERLPQEIQLQEITLRNGAVVDCVGCAYTTCMHFSEQGNCFYGGVMVEQLYPAITECDGLLLLCPNYNDALGANLNAFINRLTGLFRRRRFYEKQLFGIVVSGYSGGDIVGMQLISSLNMNKAFYLPPGFCMLETANDPGEIQTLPGIEKRAAAFAENIKKALL